MQVYAGSYHGQFVMLEGSPHALQLKVSTQVSENSLRTIACSEEDVYIGGFDQELRAFDRLSGSETKESKEGQGVITALVDVNPDLAVMGMDTGVIRFWNKREWGPRKEVKDHKKSVSDVKVDAKGKLLVSVAGKEMIFWNLNGMKPLYHYRFEYDIDQVLLVDSFEYLFLVSGNCIRQIATEDNQELSCYQGGHKIQCGLVFENFLIVATEKGEVRVWTHGNFNHCLHFQAHQTRIKAIKKQNLEGNSYLVTADSSGDIKVWDVLEFLKEVETISQDYHLEGLQPLCCVVTGHRILCMETASIDSQQPQPQKQVQAKNKRKSSNEDPPPVIKSKPIHKGQKRKKSRQQKTEY